MAVRILLFYDQFQKLITQICATQKKHLMPLKDSTHQDLWPEIYGGKIWRQNFETWIFQKRSISSHLTWINLWRSNFTNTIFKNQFFPRSSKKISKFFSKKIFSKKIGWGRVPPHNPSQIRGHAPKSRFLKFAPGDPSKYLWSLFLHRLNFHSLFGFMIFHFYTYCMITSYIPNPHFDRVRRQILQILPYENKLKFRCIWPDLLAFF